MQINYKNSEAEAFELFKYLRKSETSLKIYRKLIPIVILFLSVIISVVNYFMRKTLIRVHNGMTVDDAIFVFAPAVIGLIIIIFYFVISLLTVKENFESVFKSYKIDFNDEITLSIDEKTIKYSIDGVCVTYNKEIVREVVEKQSGIFIIFKNNSGISIPRSAFVDDNVKQEFKKIFNKI